MHSYDYWLILAFFAVVLVPAPFLGRFYYKVMEGQRTWLTPILGPVERGCYRVAGVDPHAEQSWQKYTLALLAFNLAGFLLLFAILLFQDHLPLNPQNLPGQEWTLAFNTAISFMTNTNWQAYSGEASLSYLSQMVGLTVQNFVSAATGLAVLVALCRGIGRKSTASLGNFWVDMTRATLYGLLPLCLLLALYLVWQGVPQTFAQYVNAVTMQGVDQVIPLGPAASQIAIKQLGTNGGGFNLLVHLEEIVGQIELCPCGLAKPGAVISFQRKEFLGVLGSLMSLIDREIQPALQRVQLAQGSVCRHRAFAVRHITAAQSKQAIEERHKFLTLCRSDIEPAYSGMRVCRPGERFGQGLLILTAGRVGDDNAPHRPQSLLELNRRLAEAPLIVHHDAEVRVRVLRLHPPSQIVGGERHHTGREPLILVEGRLRA